MLFYKWEFSFRHGLHGLHGFFNKVFGICHSERSEESPARTGRCFTTFSITKEIRDKIRVIRA